MSIFDGVMKSTNVSLSAFIAPQAKERGICSWTRYANLLAWFDNFKVFLIEFGFAVVGCDGEPVFDEKTMHQILNLDTIDISVNWSKTIVCGRPEVSFHDPHPPMPGSITVCACVLAATAECDSRRKEEALLQVLVPCAQHTWQVWM
jgi:hypothetical protein